MGGPSRSRGSNPANSGAENPPREGRRATVQPLRSEHIVDNYVPLDVRASQDRAFEHIAKFMEAFREGQLGGLVRQARPIIERRRKKIKLFEGTN